jgi:hypothetical protein
MRNSDPSRLHRMLELLVAPNMRNLKPTILFQAPHDFSAGHKIRYTLFTHLSNRSLEERRGTTVPLENLEIFERMGGSFSFIILADAHFSHAAPRKSVFDLPFARCAPAGESGSAPKSACFSDPREKREVKKDGACNIIAVWGSSKSYDGPDIVFGKDRL